MTFVLPSEVIRQRLGSASFMQRGLHISWAGDEDGGVELNVTVPYRGRSVVEMKLPFASAHEVLSDTELTTIDVSSTTMPGLVTLRQWTPLVQYGHQQSEGLALELSGGQYRLLCH